jgi:hypothetical protein
LKPKEARKVGRSESMKKKKNKKKQKQKQQKQEAEGAVCFLESCVFFPRLSHRKLLLRLGPNLI